MGAFLLAAAEAATALGTGGDFPSGSLHLSHWEGCDFPVGALQIPLGNEIPLGAFGRRVGVSTSGAKSEWEHGGRGSLIPLGPSPTLAFGEAPSPGPTRRREAPSACSHWEAAPLPCARHFLWGTFLRPYKPS